MGMTAEIQSMTGYGEAQEGGFKVEVKSVNHRFLDMHFRMPPILNPYEIELKRLVKERFSRGRIDVTISFTEQADIELSINQQVAGRILDGLAGITERLNISSPPSLDHLFWFRDIVFKQEPRFRPEELFVTFSRALDKLREMRIKEGAYLIENIKGIVKAIEEIIGRIEQASRDASEKRFSTLRERVKALIEGMELDEQRLMQEIAFIADRVDISEEITRLKSHISQLEGIINEGGAVGRRMDFLIQELNRETNTIGSKAADYQISEHVINLKTEIEKMREQVQNLQ